MLENFESAGCERKGSVRVKRSRVTIALDDRDDEAGLPSGRNHSEAQNEVKEGKTEDDASEILKSEYGGSPRVVKTRGTWRVQQRVRC